MDSVGAVTVEASCCRPKDNNWYQNAVVEFNHLTSIGCRACRKTDHGCSGGFEGMCGKQFYITETWF